MPSSQIFTRDFLFITLTNFFIFIGFNMTNTAIPLYISSLGAPDAIAGFSVTIVTLATLFTRPVSGYLLDTYGRKAFLVVGIAALGACFGLYALISVVELVLFVRFLQGIAWGVTSTTTTTIVADNLPRERFAEGMGYFALSTALAVAIGPALSIGMFENIGAHPLFILAAAFSFIAFGMSLFQHTLTRSELAAARNNLARSVEKSNESVSIPSAAPTTDTTNTSQTPARKSFTVSRIQALFEPRAYVAAGAMFFVNCAFGAIMSFIALHAMAQGVENIWLYFTSYAVVTLISRPLTGKLIDAKGFWTPGLASLVCIILTLILIGLSHTLTMFILAGVLGGLGMGTAMGVFQTMAVSKVEPTRRGAATSTYMLGFDTGIGAGALIAGVIAGAIGYANMFYCMAAFPACALVLAFILGKQRFE